MKTRTFVITLILVSAVLIIIGSSAIASDTEAFLQAAKSGDYATVKRFIEEGADVNAKNKYEFTVLMVALENGYTEVAKLVIEAGAK